MRQCERENANITFGHMSVAIRIGFSRTKYTTHVRSASICFGCSNAIAYLAKQRKRMCSAAYLVECRYMQTLELICHSSLSLQRISEDVFWRRLLYDRFNYLIRYWQVIFWNNVSNVGSLFLEEGAFVELQLEPYSLNAERKCIEFNKCPPLGQQRFEWFM